MKILSAQKIREADAYTIQHEPIASLDLMERAAEGCYRWIYDKAPDLFPDHLDERDYVFRVFCGVGNNGGDGLVIARLLNRSGYDVAVYIVEFSERYSPDFEANLKRLRKSKVAIKSIKQASDIPEITDDAMVIDAIFGTGIDRKVKGIAGSVISAINASKATVVAIDMPSGLFDADNSENDRAHIINAHYTLSFQFLKLAFLLGENAGHVGDCHILDIGLHPEFIAEVPTHFYYTDEQFVSSIFKSRPKFAHKGTCGHVGLFVGSHGKYGAAVMSCQGALRAGAGLVSAHVPATGSQVLQTAVPEAMVQEHPSEKILSGKVEIADYNAVGVGPGLGTDAETARLLHALLKAAADTPLVIDADGLNLIAANPEWLKWLGPNVVLTPHPGEFRRLVGDWKNDYDRLEKLMQWASEQQTYVVLKGAHTALATPDGDVFFNSTGNPGMATGGSGDVLTGVIAALLAQGYSARDASIFGVFLHGRAADIAVLESGQEAMVATDIIEHLGKAYLSLNLPTNSPR